MECPRAAARTAAVLACLVGGLAPGGCYLPSSTPPRPTGMDGLGEPVLLEEPSPILDPCDEVRECGACDEVRECAGARRVEGCARCGYLHPDQLCLEGRCTLREEPSTSIGFDVVIEAAPSVNLDRWVSRFSVVALWPENTDGSLFSCDDVASTGEVGDEANPWSITSERWSPDRHPPLRELLDRPWTVGGVPTVHGFFIAVLVEDGNGDPLATACDGFLFADAPVGTVELQRFGPAPPMDAGPAPPVADGGGQHGGDAGAVDAGLGPGALDAGPPARRDAGAGDGGAG